MDGRHILDVIGDALPELPERGDSHVSVSWATNDADALPRLAEQYPYADLEPGEWVVWRDASRRLSVQVSYLPDEPEDGA